MLGHPPSSHRRATFGCGTCHFVFYFFDESAHPHVFWRDGALYFADPEPSEEMLASCGVLGPRRGARAHDKRDQLPGFGAARATRSRELRFVLAARAQADPTAPAHGLGHAREAGRETPHRQGCSQQAHRTPPACAESSDIARTFAPRGHAGGPPPPPRQLCLFRYLAYRTAFHMSPSRSTWSTRLLECQLATAHPGPGS